MHTCVFLILNLPNTAEIFRRTEGSFDKTCPSFQPAFISLAGQVACISVCPFFCRSIGLPIDYSVCLFVCQSVGLPVAWTSLDHSFSLLLCLSNSYCLPISRSVITSSFCLSILLSVCLLVRLSALCLSFCHSHCLSVPPPVGRSVCWPFFLYAFLPVKLSLYTFFISRSVVTSSCLSVLSVYMSVCLHAYLCLSVGRRVCHSFCLPFCQ